MSALPSPATAPEAYNVEPREDGLRVVVRGAVTAELLGEVLSAVERALGQLNGPVALVWDLRAVTRFSPTLMPLAKRAVQLFEHDVSRSPAVSSSAAIRLAIASLQLTSNFPVACFETEDEAWSWALDGT